VPQRRPTADHSSRAVNRPVRNRGRSGGALDQRLERLEALLREILHTIDINGKRLTALQAQLDHLSAKSRTV
jgi:hypothetical protein